MVFAVTALGARETSSPARRVTSQTKAVSSRPAQRALPPRHTSQAVDSQAATALSSEADAAQAWRQLALAPTRRGFSEPKK